MQLYVGNLDYAVTEEELREVFSAFGSVDSVIIIKDRQTMKSKGFAFIEMADGEEAKVAIEKLNQTKLRGRTIEVNQARPRAPAQNQPYRANSGGPRKSFDR